VFFLFIGEKTSEGGNHKLFCVNYYEFVLLSDGTEDKIITYCNQASIEVRRGRGKILTRWA
jgi:hypothetical protein